MKPSIWTTMIWPSRPSEALTILAAHGWPACELSCEHLAMLAAMPAGEQAAYMATKEELGLDISQAHATITADVAAPDDQRREADLAAIHRDIELCASLGISCLVIHPGGTEAYPDRVTLEAVNARRIEAFATLAAHAERVGVRLAIENMSDGGRGVWGKRRFGAIVEEILDLIAQIGSPALGVCLDTSHANIQGLNQPEAIRTCGERLYALHISDNDGSGDQHRTPGYGHIDFLAIVAALREIGYAGNFNLEIPGENGGGRLPRALIELRSRYALGVCQLLLAQ